MTAPPTVEDAVALSRDDNGLAIVATLRADNTIQSSMVNVGLLPHPDTGEPVLGFVTYGKVKLNNLRARPQVTTTFRQGWTWGNGRGHRRDRRSRGPSAVARRRATARVAPGGLRCRRRHP